MKKNIIFGFVISLLFLPSLVLAEEIPKGCFCDIIDTENGGIKETTSVNNVHNESGCVPNSVIASILNENEKVGECTWYAVSTRATDEEKAEYARTHLTLPSNINELNQLGNRDIETIIGGVIKAGMGIMGSIFLLMIVYAGVIMMTGATSVTGGATKQDVAKAKGMIVWSTFGILVILSSYAIVNFIFGIF